jgi:hypothetical protein
MNKLYLADLEGGTEQQIKEHIMASYEADAEEVDQFEILIAYESVGSWGCDSSSFFLLKEKQTGELYEVRGSHCSCYGFEGQFEPEYCTVDYLKSRSFYVQTGGYDDDSTDNTKAIKNYIQEEL